MDIKIRRVEVEMVRSTTEKTYDMVSKYFRDSRCVYGFIVDTVDKNGVECNRITVIEVNFDKSTIRQKIFEVYGDNGIDTTTIREKWVEDVFHAYLNEGYYDSRTKEQFWSDYDKVLDGLTAIREIGYK